MKSQNLRELFLKYFEMNGHKILPSSSLIPSDPTVFLTLAGMLQFKPYFLGQEEPSYKRITTVQKCIRMNDLEQVGHTSRHQTFFEMLGNFTFSDYFKKEAIVFAWNFLTKELKIDANKLLVAVFAEDEEAYNIWNNEIKIPSKTIFRLGEDNNFWSAGETGPCGPCSEIYYDLGPDIGCGKPDCCPGCNCDRFLEIWNLVFIQYNRKSNGELEPLPKKNIDTGMGLERIVSIMQGVKNNFDTDLFKPIIDKILKISGIKKEKINSEEITAIRIIADHIRAITFLISDGLTPSNEGRGYVLRRLIRRATCYARKIKIKDLILTKLCGEVVNNYKASYPELSKKQKEIESTLKIEESNFSGIIDSGLNLFNKLIEANVDKIIAGHDAFKLHDTYGFPFELTCELAENAGFKVDRGTFLKLMEEQKIRARKASSKGMSIKEILASMDSSGIKKSKFIGYDKLETKTKVASIISDKNLIILNETTFYPEAGGQTGDVGVLIKNGNEIKIIGTYGAIGGIIVHLVDDVTNLNEKDKVEIRVDASRRSQIAVHHTGTHLLHAALRTILGPNVEQAGSHVGPDRLRFDFKHTGSLTPRQIESIEIWVNMVIKKGIKTEVFEKSIDEAKALGAMALFEAKYGKKVRLIKIGEYSLELCAGTHVKNTNEIGFFKIVSESAVSAGIRRIEAMCGLNAAKMQIMFTAKALRDDILLLIRQYQKIQVKRELLGEKKSLSEANIFELDVTELDSIEAAIDKGDIPSVNKFLEHLKGRLEWLKDRNMREQKEIERLQLKNSKDQLEENLASEKAGPIDIIINSLEGMSIANLRTLSDSIINKYKYPLIILITKSATKKLFLVRLGEELINKYNIRSKDIIDQIASINGGGGGGKDNLAEGSIPLSIKPEQIKEKIKSYLADKIN